MFCFVHFIDKKFRRKVDFCEIEKFTDHVALDKLVGIFNNIVTLEKIKSLSPGLVRSLLTKCVGVIQFFLMLKNEVLVLSLLTKCVDVIQLFLMLKNEVLVLSLLTKCVDVIQLFLMLNMFKVKATCRLLVIERLSQ